VSANDAFMNARKFPSDVLYNLHLLDSPIKLLMVYNVSNYAWTYHNPPQAILCDIRS
jgi:hypothetical protein